MKNITILKYALALVFLTCANFGSVPANAESSCGACPPFYCEDPALAARLKAQKKAEAEADGLPKRLSVLFDKLGNCAGCIETSPDWPHIVLVYDVEARSAAYGRNMPTRSMSRQWSAEDEYKARQDMRDGLVKEYHVTLGSKPCVCCKAKNIGEYKEWRSIFSGENLRDDKKWNEDIRVYEDTSISNTDKSDVKSDPKDLSTLKPRYQKEAPKAGNVSGFNTESPVRVVQVMCKNCQGLADDYNELGEKINKANLNIATYKRNIAHAGAMIEFLRFQNDGYAELAKTDEVLEKIKSNERDINHEYDKLKSYRSGLRKVEQEVLRYKAEARSLMTKLSKCEKTACKKKPEDIVEPKEDAKTPVYYVVGGSILPTQPQDFESVLDIIQTSTGSNISAGPENGPAKSRTSPCPECDEATEQYNAAAKKLNKNMERLFEQNKTASKAYATVEEYREDLSEKKDKVNKRIDKLDDKLDRLWKKFSFYRFSENDSDQRAESKKKDQDKINKEINKLYEERSAVYAELEPYFDAIQIASDNAKEESEKLNHFLKKHKKNLKAVDEARKALDNCALKCPAEVEARKDRIAAGTFGNEGFDGQGFIEREDGKGVDRVNWKNVSTDCEPCKGLVEAYNKKMDYVYYLRFQIEQIEEVRRNLRAGESTEISEMPSHLSSFFGGYGMLNSMMLGTMLEREEALNRLQRSYKSKLETDEQIARELATQIQICEEQCVADGTKTSGIIGSLVPISITKLPFDWKGPYSTTCYVCEKLVAELNRLPDLARAEILTIENAKAEIEILKARKAQAASLYGYANHIQRGDTDDYDRDGIPDKITELEGLITDKERSIEESERKLQKIKAHFNVVLRMLKECEAEYCKDTLKPSLISIELERVLTILGFNPFDLYEVERIESIGSNTNVSTNTGGGGGGGAFDATSTGASIFTHTVGVTACPTPAGTLSITSNSGNPLTISAVSVSGTLTTRLDTGVSGNGSINPTIATFFNCSSATPGAYAGSIMFTVTDTITSETEVISVSASGTVI